MVPNVGPLELLFFVAPLFWILPSYLVAKYAEGKGWSFAGFFLLGLFVSWILSGIVALIVEDKAGATAARRASDADEIAYLKQLETITRLREAGTLSESEFLAEKRRLLEKRQRLQV